MEHGRSKREERNYRKEEICGLKASTATIIDKTFN